MLVGIIRSYGQFSLRAEFMDEYVAEELQAAREAASDAEKMHESGVTDNAIVNRLYYACFHAAQAALASKDVSVTSHRGLVSMFGKELVKTGEASPEQGRFLNTMQMYRLTADYEHKPIDAEITDLLSQTKRFVGEMERLCRS